MYSPPWHEMRTSIAASAVTSSAFLTAGTVLPMPGAGVARLRSGEEDWIDQIEVPLLAHALHEHGTHHATPTDDAYLHLCILTGSGSGHSRRLGPSRPPCRSAADNARVRRDPA